jgi:hypothetical protein
LITPTKEITMFRNFAIAAILTLSASAAQAEDDLATRIHEAAVKACSVEASASLPASHYGTISAHCVDRISNAAMASMHARQVAETQASTAANN